MFISDDTNSVEITVNITGIEMYTLVHVVLISLLHDFSFLFLPVLLRSLPTVLIPLYFCFRSPL